MALLSSFVLGIQDTDWITEEINWTYNSSKLENLRVLVHLKLYIFIMYTIGLINRLLIPESLMLNNFIGI